MPIGTKREIHSFNRTVKPNRHTRNVEIGQQVTNRLVNTEEKEPLQEKGF